MPGDKVVCGSGTRRRCSSAPRNVGAWQTKDLPEDAEKLFRTMLLWWRHDSAWVREYRQLKIEMQQQLQVERVRADSLCQSRAA